MRRNYENHGMNPYLPSWEYVPDGEPHVFGKRVYIYGSHDRFAGYAFARTTMYAGQPRWMT